MPRLLRMAARTAVVAGTASAVSGRVQHRQAGKWNAQQQQEPAPAAPSQVAAQPAPPSTTDTLQQLKDLGELKGQGVLTEAEFAAEKARILAR